MSSVELKTTEAPAIPEVVDRTAETDGVSQDIKTTEVTRRPRRKASRFRKIPRSPTDDKESKVSRLAKGGRQRTTSVSSVASGRSQRRGGKTSRRRTASEASAISEAGETSPLRKLRDTVMEKYQKKGLNLLNSYIKNRMEFAKFDNTTSFLERCDALQIVPNKYRLTNNNIKNTKHVVRLLDRYSFNLLFADLKYNRKRRFQVNKLLNEKEDKMREMFSEELVKEILQVAGETYDRRSNRIRDQQAKIFDSLVKEYGITDEEKNEGEQRLKRMEEREKVRQERRTLEKQAKSPEKADHSEENSPVKETSDNSKADGDKPSKDQEAQPAGDAEGAGARAVGAAADSTVSSTTQNDEADDKDKKGKQASEE